MQGRRGYALVIAGLRSVLLWRQGITGLPDLPGREITVLENLLQYCVAGRAEGQVEDQRKKRPRSVVTGQARSGQVRRERR